MGSACPIYNVRSNAFMSAWIGFAASTRAVDVSAGITFRPDRERILWMNPIPFRMAFLLPVAAAAARRRRGVPGRTGRRDLAAAATGRRYVTFLVNLDLARLGELLQRGVVQIVG